MSGSDTKAGGIAEWVGKVATPLRLGLLVAIVVGSVQAATLTHYALTVDSGALFYSGDRTLYWLRHLGEPGALDYRGPEPANFKTIFERFPDHNDPLHYPVLPGFVGTLTSQVFHDALGLLDQVEGHHLGLILLNSLGLVLFCVYASRVFGRRAGFLATLFLALFPTAYGHVPNNAKDWPCAMFYGVSILAAAHALIEGRARHLLAAALLLGVSMSAKMNAAFVAPTLILWAGIPFFLLYWRRRPVPGKLLLAAAAAPVVVVGFFVLAWPWLWYGGPKDWLDHWQEYYRFMSNYGFSPRETWTDYPLRCLLFMSPPIVLLTAGLYLASPAWRRDREHLVRWSLVVIWLAVPIGRMVVPHSNFYDANRHFIEYVPALCMFAGAGLSLALDLFGKLGPRLAAPASAGLLAIAAVGVLWPLVEYFPYEKTYFNSLIGGLGGAQRKALFYMPPPHERRVLGTEGDYWNSSLRDALEDLRGMVQPGDAVSVCGAPGPDEARANSKERPIARYLDWWEPEYHTSPFMLVIPRETLCWWREILEFERERPVLKRVERGGGLIYEILGKPTGQKFEPVSDGGWYEANAYPLDGVGQRREEARRVAQGRPVVKRVNPGGIIVYDVVDPQTGEVVWRQPDP